MVISSRNVLISISKNVTGNCTQDPYVPKLITFDKSRFIAMILEKLLNNDRQVEVSRMGCVWASLNKVTSHTIIGYTDLLHDSRAIELSISRENMGFERAIIRRYYTGQQLIEQLCQRAVKRLKRQNKWWKTHSFLGLFIV